LIVRRFVVSGCLAVLAGWPASVEAGGPLFVEDSAALAPACAGGDGCWTNYLRVTDLDGDDDLDVVLVNMQGLFQVGPGEPLVIYENDGTGVFTNVSDTAVADHSDQHREVAIADFDGDGDPDIYAPHAAGGTDVLFTNEGDLVFTAEDIDLGSSAGAARPADLDDDGDMDLVLSGGYDGGASTVLVYLNDGAGALTELAGAVPGSASGMQPIDVDLFDADGDFDLDILLDTHQGDNGLWLNDGTGMFTEASDGLPSADNLHYGPGVCDVDGDGDLDIWIDNAGPGREEQLLINDGAGAFTDESADRITGNSDADDNGVACIDVDYDGDFDAVVISLFTAERYFVNDGTGNFSLLNGAFTPGGLSELWGEFGDVDGDGRLDLVTGAGESGDLDRVFLGSKVQDVDATPPAIRAVQTPTDVAADTEVVVHFAVTDNAVTDEGPRLHGALLRVTIGAEMQDVPAGFMGGDLFRAVVPGQPEGTMVSFQACATDRQDNEGCADAIVFEVGGGAGTGSTDGGSGDAGSESGTVDAGTVDESGSASLTATDGSATSASATDSADAGDSSGTSEGEDEDGGGCGCRQSTPSVPAPWLLVLSIGALGLRRRR